MAKTPQVAKLLYTKTEAAYALARSCRPLERMIAQGLIATRKAGNRTLIPASEVRRVAATNYYPGRPPSPTMSEQPDADSPADTPES